MNYGIHGFDSDITEERDSRIIDLSCDDYHKKIEVVTKHYKNSKFFTGGNSHFTFTELPGIQYSRLSLLVLPVNNNGHSSWYFKLSGEEGPLINKISDKTVRPINSYIKSENEEWHDFGMRKHKEVEDMIIWYLSTGTGITNNFFSFVR